MIKIKTIVKGKNVKLNYEHQSFYCTTYNPFEHPTIRMIKYKIEILDWGNIISNEEITYETYFESEDINYRLNIGEKFNGNIVELIEGTDCGDIVYYTDKVLQLDENVQEKNKIKDDIDNQIQELQRELERTELRIQIEELRNCNKDLKRDKKKWYQFWK